ncbi:hypothetical protein NM688_g4751 [Phlebia brevispora]|uniref:Uncharacterized protein n=1 Tax=Phlebia brevispora TaxID=194682 RepID=A0ACC1T213_9APHY|nr:hypothetical protein NM688_g4751 [Phlebia brevispora]
MSGAPSLSYSEYVTTAEHLVAAKMYSLAACVMLFYDICLTFGDEVEKIWKRPFTGATILWFANRYLNPLGYIVVIVSFHQQWPESVCNRYILYPEALKTVTDTAIGMIFILRLYAIYSRSRVILGMFTVLLLTEIGMKIVRFLALGVRSQWLTDFNLQWSFTDGLPVQLPPGLVGCILTGRSERRFIWTFVVELIFGSVWSPRATIVKTLKIHRSLSSSNTTYNMLINIMLRDGILYFAAIFGANLITVVFLLTATPDLKPINASFSNLLTSLMVSRLMLNLRIAADERYKRSGHTTSTTIVREPLPHSNSLKKTFEDTVIGNLGEDVAFYTEDEEHDGKNCFQKSTMALFEVPGWTMPTAPVAGPSTSSNSRKRKRHDSEQDDAKLQSAAVNMEKLMEKLAHAEEGGEDSRQSRKNKKAKARVNAKSKGKDSGKTEAVGSTRGRNEQSKVIKNKEGGKQEQKQREKARRETEDLKQQKSIAPPAGSSSGNPERPRKQQKKIGQAVDTKAHQEADADIHVPEPAHKKKNGEHPAAEEGLTAMQARMKQSLDGARFRWINETLYKSDSVHAHDMMRENPSVFTEYHTGFRHQVQSWPVNPVSHYISALSSYPPKTVIADLGCGDAALARALVPEGFTVLSYDLVSDGEFVIEADTCSKIPLPGREAEADEESPAAQVVDVVVCALSLMGTNWVGCIREAWRILKPGRGELKIAEVASRFTEMEAFISTVSAVGFKLRSKFYLCSLAGRDIQDLTLLGRLERKLDELNDICRLLPPDRLRLALADRLCKVDE